MIPLSAIKPFPCLTPGSAVVVVEAGEGASPDGDIAIDNVTGLQAALDAPRTPTAHKASHATGGADPLTPEDIGAATASQGALAASAVQPGVSFAAGQIDANGGIAGAFGAIAFAPYGSQPFVNVGVNAYYAFCSTSPNAFVAPDSALHPATGGILLMTPNKSGFVDLSLRSLIASGSIRPASYTVAAALALVGMAAGDTIYVTNETGGACLATYNGSAWKRQTDLATIS